jgi:hypothetical protein
MGHFAHGTTPASADEINRLIPSGAAFAAFAVPMSPLAPGTFSLGKLERMIDPDRKAHAYPVGRGRCAGWAKLCP